MPAPPRRFETPTTLERLFNGVLGTLLRFGIGLKHMRILEVRGRKSGRLYSLPVDLLEQEGRLFLVAPRGRAQWVRNAEAAGEVTLRRGGSTEQFGLRALADAEKGPVLKAYLDQFRAEVQRFFPVPAGSPVEQFSALAPNYPAFELLRR